MRKKIFFLTGTTGLLGSYLLKILLQKDHKVYVLARSRNNQTARERVKNVLSFWDKDFLNENKIRNCEVIEGDVTQINLGLKFKQLVSIEKNVDEFFHCAAVTKFNLPLNKARKVNFYGTNNVLSLALKCKKIYKVNHISTAYVCGNYSGVFFEKDLNKGQNFLTTYEQSKFEAERLVEKFRKKGLWIDIFRPPVIGAETNSGKILSSQAFFQLLRLWCLELFDIFPGEETSFNFIPVDSLAKIVINISGNSFRINQNYHPFNSKKIFLKDILNISSKFLNFKKPRLITFEEFKKVKISRVKREILDLNVNFLDRHSSFNSFETCQFLKKYNLSLPNFKKNDLIRTLSFFKKIYYE